MFALRRRASWGFVRFGCFTVFLLCFFMICSPASGVNRCLHIALPYSSKNAFVHVSLECEMLGGLGVPNANDLRGRRFGRVYYLSSGWAFNVVKKQGTELNKTRRKQRYEAAERIHGQPEKDTQRP